MPKRKFDSVVINEDVEISLVNKRSKADDTEKDMGHQVSSPSNTIYSNKNIKLLLKSYFLNGNIEDIYIFKVTGDHIYFNFINNLKAKLIHETKNKIVPDYKFYVIIEQSINNDLQVSSATILKLYNKNNKNQIKILPIVDGSTSGSLRDELKKALELSKISIKVDDLSDWFLENQSINVYLDNLIEVIKLSIEYKSPNKIPDDKIIEIMDIPHSEYEKIHQELLNTLKLADYEEINELSLADKDQDEVISSSRIKKTVSWDSVVEDNEGHTIRKKKKKIKENKKEKNEIEEYFEQCITSWNWDQKIWEERYFNTNRLDSDKFKELIDKYCDEIIVKNLGNQVLSKHHYDNCNNTSCNDTESHKSLDKIIEGYVFLINYSPNLFTLLKENQEIAFRAFSQCDVDVLGFYKAHPELKLTSLIGKRIGNIDIVVKDQDNIINPISDDKIDAEILIDVTNYDQENSELKLTESMEAKAQFAAADHAKIYRSYRRDTPLLLIEKAVSYLKEKYDGPLDLAVDVCCGSGQSTVNIAPFFKKVHGIDVSEAQIKEAKANRALPNVTYEAAPAETIPFNDGSVQLVSAGAALHWFQLDAFFPEVRRVLCNNGILMVYCYFSLKPLLEDPALTEKVDKLWNEMHSMTANYHAPQAKIAFDLYKDIVFPFEETAKFDNVREIFDGELQDIIGYISTFSGFQNWKRQEEKKASEFIAYVEKRFREIIAASKLDPDKPLKLYRDFFLIICRKVQKES